MPNKFVSDKSASTFDDKSIDQMATDVFDKEDASKVAAAFLGQKDAKRAAKVAGQVFAATAAYRTIQNISKGDIGNIGEKSVDEIATGLLGGKDAERTAEIAKKVYAAKNLYNMAEKGSFNLANMSDIVGRMSGARDAKRIAEGTQILGLLQKTYGGDVVDKLPVDQILNETIQIFPYVYKNLLEFEIIQQGLNEHSTIHFKAVIDEVKQEEYMAQTLDTTNLVVAKREEDGSQTMLFQGIVLDAQIQNVQGVYYLIVEGISHSYSLDISKKNRSFQNAAMSYEDMIQQVTAPYEDVDFMDNASKGAPIGQFTMQYQETDWQFLKRMASRFQTGLVAVDFAASKRFYFGIPETGTKGELISPNYRLRKDVSRYLVLTQNDGLALSEQDFVYYMVTTKQIFGLGDKVTFNGRELFVCSAFRSLEKGSLTHHYDLATEKGMTERQLYNTPIIGASINGTVLSIKQDKIRIQLHFDDQTDESTAHWFPYSTTYTSENNVGWYMMPEIGDTIRAYFPSKKEEEAIAISSVSAMEPSDNQPTLKGGIPKDDKKGATSTGSSAFPMSDPNIKTLRNQFGKTITLEPNKITIVGGTFAIVLNDDDGIIIQSEQNIQMISKQDMLLSAEKIILNGTKEINIQCKNNKIAMADDIQLTGTEVHMN
ncbi:contractile injection system protein, VgrG/Pvc8 family [Listeria goaensis]|uniref:contractile injection system protein, VgrG/Pvc8 family n=1 Tax=Listeria goaensis TaxID=1649188 RepID=UPI000B59541D|nr:contractile injection system protein, VgrG/Pvc8 family [Listeria goaensis]